MSLQNMVSRCTVALATAMRKMQALQIRLTAGEVKDDVEHMEPYGYTSNPHPGAEGIAVFPGGDRSHGVVVVVADRRFRLKGLKPGEVALYTDEGDKIHFERGRKLTVVTATLNIQASELVDIQSPELKHNGVNIGFNHDHGNVLKGGDRTSGPG
ncbi:phage baseplate assembly protein V [Comamonas terrigena]|uniref:phage baseplate assembly protein V n=1 Tax=Comamonas terrigena TaxID=32013 RepID=UPI0024477A5E|nr:phage baseplate assembly protein V [Comamonas terrigena]MDH1499349.1 phage baseplate assembly protein V [Comamonas terrigena]